MRDDENESITNSQNVTNVKIQDGNSTALISSPRQSQGSNEKSIYNEVDNLFFG